MTLTFLLAAFGFALCAMFFASRTLLPIAHQFMTYSSAADSLHAKIFPVLAFIALVGILAKLTLF